MKYFLLELRKSTFILNLKEKIKKEKIHPINE